MKKWEIEEVEKILEGITPGEWLVEERTVYALSHAGYRKGEEQFQNRFYAGLQVGFLDDGSRTPLTELLSNARFIAAAPSIIRSLLTQLKEVKNRVDLQTVLAYEAGQQDTARECAEIAYEKTRYLSCSNNGHGIADEIRQKFNVEG